MPTVNTDRNYQDMVGNAEYKPKTSGSFDVVFDNDKKEGVNFDDFFNLMLMQLRNQDFMNPQDDTQYLTQLAQIATMKAMEEISYYGKSNFAMSYLGKEVTAAKNEIGGKISTEVGIVTQISLVDGDYKLTVNGKQFSLKEIMILHDTPVNIADSGNDTAKKPDADNKTDSTEGTNTDNTANTPTENDNETPGADNDDAPGSDD